MKYATKIGLQVAGLSVAGLLASTACSRENDRPASDAHTAESKTAETTPVAETEGRAAPLSPATSSARASIAESRCQREQRCENIGDKKTFASMSDCITRIGDEWKEDLNARECPSGVNQSELSECLTQIRGEDCNNPFDKLSRVAACTSNQICKG